MNFLKGTGVAIITPFKKSGEIDFNAYQLLIDFYINNNISYLVILGTTGESNTISFEEKSRILENTVKFNNGRVPLVVGIGGNDTQNLVNQILNYDLKKFSAIYQFALTITNQHKSDYMSIFIKSLKLQIFQLFYMMFPQEQVYQFPTKLF